MRDEKLDFWLKHGFNVCFVGQHGVGKTAMVKACFERAGLSQGDTYLYFSGSTLDPWVDFVGVPKEKTVNKIPEWIEIIRELVNVGEDVALEYVKGHMHLNDLMAKRVMTHALGRKEGMTFLELVRPEAFARDAVKAIFVDEYNRSPKKVRNAVMELLQFKSINGKKFPNLTTVWTAINPADDEQNNYDVEEIDPAQMDRFVVSVRVPYKPNEGWFIKRYGERVGRTAIQWWTDLSTDEQKLVSPRRLEYALNMWEVKGDMRDVLPFSSCVVKLMTSLNTGPISERIEAMFKDKDNAAAKLFLSNENNYAPAMKVICESEAMMEFFIPLLNKEKISLLLSENERARRYITSSFNLHPIFQEAMRDILTANQNKPLVKVIRRALTDTTVLATGFGPGKNDQPAPPHFVKGADKVRNWGAKIAELKPLPVDTTGHRTKLYSELVAHIPEKMTGDEAVATLELLNGLMQRAWQTTLTSDTGDNKMPLVINMTNHAIAQLAIGKSMSWSEIVSAYGSKIKNLLDKLKGANLASKLFTPAKA